MKKTILSLIMVLCALHSNAQQPDIDEEIVVCVGYARPDFETDTWYFLHQSREGAGAGTHSVVDELPSTGGFAYDNGVGERAMKSDLNAIWTWTTVKDAARYMVRFIRSSKQDGAYIMQFGTGNYLDENLSTVTDVNEAVDLNVYLINDEPGHFAINQWEFGARFDNNGAGSVLAWWGSGQTYALNGNNDWAIHDVDWKYIDYASTDGYYNIVSAMSWDDGETKAIYVDNDAIKWGTLQEYIPFLWKLEHSSANSVTFTNMLTGGGFNELSRSTPVTIANTPTDMRLWRIKKDEQKRTVFAFTNSSQTGEYSYVHCRYHEEGAGTGGDIIGWTTTTEASHWVFVPVSIEDAETMIEAHESYDAMKADANARLYNILVKDSIPLIYDVSQLSSPYTEPSEGSLEALLDGDVSTFWHSVWTNGYCESGTHYLQVKLPEGTEILDDVAFTFTRRMTRDSHITQWSVYGVDVDDENIGKAECELLAVVNTPFVNDTDCITSFPFSVNGHKYLRFYFESTTTNHGFAHMSEFQLYEIIRNRSSYQYETMGEIATNLEAVLKEQAKSRATAISAAQYRAFKTAYVAFVDTQTESNDDAKRQIEAGCDSIATQHALYVVSLDALQTDSVKALYHTRLNTLKAAYTDSLQALIAAHNEYMTLPQYLTTSNQYVNNCAVALKATAEEAVKADVNAQAETIANSYIAIVEAKSDEYIEKLNGMFDEVKDEYTAKMQTVSYTYTNSIQALIDEYSPALELQLHLTEVEAIKDEALAELAALMAEAYKQQEVVLSRTVAAGDNMVNDKNMQFKTFAMEVNDVESLYSTLQNFGTMTADSVWVSDILPADKWTFITLPFSVKMEGIAYDDVGVQYSIRRYDGAGRAQNGMGDNWKRVGHNEILAAGEGFIIQHNAATGSERFVFPASEGRDNIFVTGDVVVPLAEHPSAHRNDRDWNFIGNPYPCYYDMSHSDFTAPVTVWNGEGYDAYRPHDDEVVLHPFEAFFVQRQDREAITFTVQAPSPVPPRGEAVTNDSDKRTGTEYSGLRTGTRQSSIPFSGTRTLINLSVHALPHGEGRGGGFEGQGGARTRIVLNDLASRDYEPECDAAKFFGGSIDLYTVEGGTAYAINERPLDDGIVSVGFSCAEAGTYTITADRPVTLIDKQLGTTAVLGIDDGGYAADGTPTLASDTFTTSTLARDAFNTPTLSAYTFTAPAGNTATRFELRLGEVTNIADAPSTRDDAWYTMSGVRLSQRPTQRGIYIRSGRKVAR